MPVILTKSLISAHGLGQNQSIMIHEHALEDTPAPSIHTAKLTAK